MPSAGGADEGTDEGHAQGTQQQRARDADACVLAKTERVRRLGFLCDDEVRDGAKQREVAADRRHP